MSRFIQSLEERRLFTATGTQLSADLSTILHDAQAVRAALVAERSTIAAGMRTVFKDLRGATNATNKKENAALVANVKQDAASNSAQVITRQTKLLSQGGSLSSQVSTTAKSLLLHPTNTKLQSHLSTLNGQLETDLLRAPSDLTAWNDTYVSAFGSELDQISSANPTTTIVSAVNTAAANAQVKDIPYDTAVNKFANDAGTLSTDAQPTG